MPKAIRVYTKKTRAAGAGTMVGVRLQPDQLDRLDAWIAKQGKTISRPQAIRAFIEAGLRVMEG